MDGHKIHDCEKFKSLDNASKMEAIRSRAICFKCLEGKHLARNCTSDIRCNVKVG